MEQIQITNDYSTHSLNHLIDQTFTNVKRLFVLSFPRNNNTDNRYSHSNCYVTKVEISDFNVLIDGKSFLDLPVKNAETYKKIIEISNHDNTTGNLLDFAYFKKHYKLITIDLSIQTKLKGPQQINFIGKLLKNTGATIFFIIEKSDETNLKFSQNFATII